MLSNDNLRTIHCTPSRHTNSPIISKNKLFRTSYINTKKTSLEWGEEVAEPNIRNKRNNSLDSVSLKPRNSGARARNDMADRNAVTEIPITDMEHLVKLIFEPASATVDSYLQDVVLLNFRRFMKPRKLLDLAIKAYSGPNGSIFSMGRPLRVVSTLRKWITRYYWTDFHHDKKLLEKFWNFLGVQASDLDTLKDELKCILTKLDSESINHIKPWCGLDSSPKKRNKTKDHNVYQFLRYGDNFQELTRQWVLLEAEWFCSVSPSEWTSKSKQPKNGFLQSLIEFFNHTSLWVATTIVTARNMDDRIRVIDQFIKIAMLCLKYKSFNTLFEIMAGFNMVCVQRLTLTFNCLSESTVESLKELELIISPQHNYKYYRNLLNGCTGLALPFMGVISKDIALLEENLEDYHSVDNKKFINLDKLFNFSDLICGQVGKVQEKAFMYKQIIKDVDERMRNFLLDSFVMDEDKLWEISISIQPPFSDKPKRKKI